MQQPAVRSVTCSRMHCRKRREVPRVYPVPQIEGELRRHYPVDGDGLSSAIEETLPGFGTLSKCRQSLCQYAMFF